MINQDGVVQEYICKPFGRDALREDPNDNWSVPVTTSDANWTTVQSVTIDPEVSGKPEEIEIQVTWAQKSSGATKYVRGRVVIQSEELDDVESLVLDGAATYYIQDDADASAYTEHTVSGNIDLTAGRHVNAPNHAFGTLHFPFYLKVQVQREDANENASGKVKDAGFVRVKFR